MRKVQLVSIETSQNPELTHTERSIQVAGQNYGLLTTNLGPKTEKIAGRLPGTEDMIWHRSEGKHGSNTSGEGYNEAQLKLIRSGR